MKDKIKEITVFINIIIVVNLLSVAVSSLTNDMITLIFYNMIILSTIFGVYYYLRPLDIKKEILDGTDLLFVLFLMLVISFIFVVASYNTTIESIYPIEEISVLYVLLTFVFVVVEEFVFRGIIFGRLFDGSNLWSAAIISSFLFSIYHTIALFNIATGFFMFIFGIAFCLLYEDTDSIYSPIIVHFTYNMVILLVVIS
jgi:membrane protease YdiL (CAAX protease family)